MSLSGSSDERLVLAEVLLERAESAEMVSRFAQAIATQFTLPNVVGVAVQKTSELCGADGASLLLVDAASGELYFDTVSGEVSERIERVRLRKGLGIAGRVAQEAKPRLVTSAKDCPEFDASADKQSGFRTGSIIAAPLIVAGDVVGVLEAVRPDRREPFTASHLRRLEALAPHVAIAVHNAQMTTALRDAQKGLVDANQELEHKVEERAGQIARAKREWESTFDAISEPLALVESFRIRRANLAYARRAGLPIREIPGKTCHQVLAGRSTPCPGCPLVGGIDEEGCSEARIGDSTFRISSFPLGGESGARSMVLRYEDVTKQRLLEGRLRESERLAAVGQLASGAAHEINNPLAFVISNLDSLKGLLDELGTDGGDKKELLRDGQEMVDESLQGAKRVREIVRALRELSRLEVGGAQACSANASVTRVARAELGGMTPPVELALEATADAAIGPLHLDQVLAHLVRNARQAVGRGQRVFVRTESDSKEVRIHVRDEGGGITPENLRRVFEPFFTTRGVGKGLGLGLTAAYGIVRRAGGRIDVHSEVGKGACFTVCLPLSQRAETPLDVPDSPVAASALG